jgi:integrase
MAIHPEGRLVVPNDLHHVQGINRRCERAALVLGVGHGKTPYTYQILFRRHIRPVVERISGIKSSKEAPIGWHTLRRSLATLLISNGENVKVAQSQLRHTTPKITLEFYAQAVSADQQEAHKRVVQMMLPSEFPEKLKARGVTAMG